MTSWCWHQDLIVPVEWCADSSPKACLHACRLAAWLTTSSSCTLHTLDNGVALKIMMACIMLSLAGCGSRLMPVSALSFMQSNTTTRAHLL
jgi:hypothetical protein